VNIAFDVDGTLIVPYGTTGSSTDTPNYDVIAIFRWFQSQGHHMIIWSGSGTDYAKRWADKLGLQAEIRVKQKSADVDIAFDDMSGADLGNVNISVRWK